MKHSISIVDNNFSFKNKTVIPASLQETALALAHDIHMFLYCFYIFCNVFVLSHVFL